MKLFSNLIWFVILVIHRIFDFTPTILIENKNIFTNKINDSFLKVQFQRITASVLLSAFVSPMIFFGQVKTVQAKTFAVNPVIEIPGIITAPPEPFQFSANTYHYPGQNTPLLFGLGIWEKVSSWFGNSPSENSVLQSNCPSGYSSIGIAMVGNPSAAVLGNRLFAFIRGTDNAIYWKYTEDGVNFSNWLSLGGGTYNNPRTLVNGGTLYLEVTGTDNNTYYQSTTNGGNNWSGWISGTVNAQTTATATFLGNSYTFAAGSGTQIPLCYQVGSPTPTPTPTPTPSNPNSPPTQTGTTLPTSTNLSRVRLAPVNQTGGTSLYSRNFGWGTGLAGLPGRGLDAGFGISYNSLMWIRKGNEMVFNPNNDNITPGFRFGFPVIEPQYSDPVTNKNTFLMVTPTGSRVEFRQVPGSTDTFETADSSYTQLKVLDANNLQLTGTDGTNAFYQLKGGAFRCQQIKDANGNFITVSYDNNGLLQSVNDTLNRVINVNYDNQGSPVSVTQTRATGTFTFATLTYSSLTISTNFAGLNLVGITNGTTIKVLDKISYPDGSFTQFEYNSYGQVWRINNHAADAHKLNYTATNLQTISGTQTDVPRFTEMRNWTENFNLNASNVAQEVVIPIVYQENAGFILPNGSTASGTLLHVTAPDGTISKTFVGGTGAGWLEAMPIVTEDWANEGGNWNRKRWSYSAYTQDDINLGYILNPRTIESKIGDVSNVKRSTVDYWTQSGNPNASLFGLVKEVKVYDADQTTVLKRSTTDYNLDSNYLARRIIGLPSKNELYDQANVLVAKTTYNYDEFDFSGAGQNITPINQDATNFGAGLVYRGNATSATKWDVTDPNNTAKAIVTSRVKYNTAGNPVSSLDPLNREIKTSYTDNFDDNQNRNTFGYPTQITDPAGNSSTVKYRFDFGANVYAQSPAPAGQTVGKQTSRIFDALGRLEKEIVNNTGAYTRYEYPTNGIQSKVFSTITDVNNNGADTADEVLSESFSDGAGRTRMARSEHPNSTGGYSGTITEYDIMGRVKRSTVPTEVNSSWTPSGDDATRGWLWSSQEYDWKGRVTRQINTDGTDRLMSYDGCGCAGGQVTTVSGEQLAEGRRRQKVYEDILGRTYKSETLNWDGSVYSTSKSFFNGRDQVITARQYAGADGSSTFQDTTATFDGYGRLKTQHRPEQNANTATTYNYYADDRIQQVVDARGATINYSYDNRGLTTQVSTTSPNASVVPVTPTVSFVYDNLGNRTSMTDGLGTQTYEYNQLSQLTAETRQFNESLPGAPLSNNRFKLEYTYSLSGQLKSYKEPFGLRVDYAFDKVGRLSSVSGNFNSNTVNYANNPTYTARGNLTHLDYGNGTSFQISSFNNKLQATNYELKHGATSLLNKQYEYYNDGVLKKEVNQTHPNFDKLYLYDHAARMTQALTGMEANGQTAPPTPPVVTPSTPTMNVPYRYEMQYNQFGNQTQNSTRRYISPTGVTNQPYLNNRKVFVQNQTPYLQYDAEGNQTYDLGWLRYDAVGQLQAKMDVNYAEPLAEYLSDGEGKILKTKTYEYTPATEETPASTAISNVYSIRSSVFGEEIAQAGDGGGQLKGIYVRANGTTIAIASQNGTVYSHKDVSLSSIRTTLPNGNLITDDNGSETSRHEFDPTGNAIGFDGYAYNPGTTTTDNGDLLGGFPRMQGTSGQTYTVDGIRVPEEYAKDIINSASFGGMLGLLEKTARISAQRVKIGEWWRTETWDTGGSENVISHTLTYKTSDVYGGYAHPNWAINWNMISWEHRQTSDIPKLGGNPTKTEQQMFGTAYNGMLAKLNPKTKEGKACLDALGGEEKVKEALKKWTFDVSTNLGKPTELFGSWQLGQPVAQVNEITKNIRLNAYGSFFMAEGRNGTGTLIGRDGKTYPTFLEDAQQIPSTLGDSVMTKDLLTTRVLYLLHELSHVTGKFGGDATYGSDGKIIEEFTKKKQSEVNDAVIKGCFKMLKKINKEAGGLSTVTVY